MLKKYMIIILKSFINNYNKLESKNNTYMSFENNNF